MSNPFRINNPAKPGQDTRYYSDRHEQSVAKALGGRQTKKSDVLTDLFTVECKTKTTNSDSISIKRAWFDKQMRESIQMGKRHSTIVFNFGPDAPYNENHYIIDEYLFLELLEYLKHKE